MEGNETEPKAKISRMNDKIKKVWNIELTNKGIFCFHILQDKNTLCKKSLVNINMEEEKERLLEKAVPLTLHKWNTARI